MAYQNINFPEIKLIHGLNVASERPVTVVSNFAKEYRINRYSQGKLYFTFPSRNMRYSDFLVLASFADTVKDTTDSFNFISPLSGTTYKVRFVERPTMTVVAMNTLNQPIIVLASEIKLKQVFNE